MKKPTKKTAAKIAAKEPNPELEAVAAAAEAMEKRRERELQEPVVSSPPEPAAPESAAAEVSAIEGQDAGVAIIACELVRTIGSATTRIAAVAPLSDGEVRAIGGALARLLELYDFTKMEPRAAAWVSLGIAVAGAAVPRVNEALARRFAHRQDPPADDVAVAA